MPEMLWNICGGGIYIDVDPNDRFFYNQMLTNLNRIETYKVGKALLDGIAVASRRGQSGILGNGRRYKVVIRETMGSPSEKGSGNSWKAFNNIELSLSPKNSNPQSGFMTNGRGGDSEVFMNVSRPLSLGGKVQDQWIILAHELIHSYHTMCGDQPGDYDTKDTTPNAPWKHEEARTIGLKPYGKGGITENALREEAGLEQRTGNADLIDGFGNEVDMSQLSLWKVGWKK